LSVASWLQWQRCRWLERTARRKVYDLVAITQT
jgi:hypothetical protein